MEYETFKKELLDSLRRKTEEGIKVRIQTVEKNNGIRAEAVVILGEKECIAPTIYLQEFYEDWKNSGDIERAADQILKRNACQEREVDFSLDCFENYEAARGQVYFKLINYEMNQILLRKVPHIIYLDLAVVFYYRLERGRFQGATMLIHNCNLDSWTASSYHSKSAFSGVCAAWQDSSECVAQPLSPGGKIRNTGLCLPATAEGNSNKRSGILAKTY